MYIYIYIYCHPQTECFVLSELFSVARHVGRSKPGSKPIQLYVRLNLKPLDRQANHVGQGSFKVFRVQSQVDSYHRLRKWYLMPPCLALSIIRLGSRVEWSNPDNGETSALKPRCSSY